MDRLAPINFRKWIEENRHLLKPPVGNRQIWENREFMVTVVGGPNSRTDYHINEGEEFFYQVEEDIEIREGDTFLMPPKVPHSPQRPAGTVGLVLERKRRENELDGFVWYCQSCGLKLHEEFLHVTDIVSQLPPVFERFFGNPAHTTCKSCGTQMQKLAK
jgi:3-hydroxyanthranilate 3,4-dioxygenase